MILNNTDFSSLKLSNHLLDNLTSLGYSKMTPVQAKALPYILSQRDVIAQSKTGSGKTVAFSLGLLAGLKVKYFAAQSMVLCPTRELANQVATEIRKLARTTPNVKVVTLCGGTPYGPQLASLAHGAHIIVGTPGRVQDHVNKGTLSLDNLRILVLDEADRMLDMGFEESIEFIIARTPEKRQTLLFSATYPDNIEKIAANVMNRPQHVNIATQHTAHAIRSYFYRLTQNKERIPAIKYLLQRFKTDSTLIFCNTKKECQSLTDHLQAEGFSVKSLHGDLEQKQRNEIMVQFSNRSLSVLVATDLAARGLDISDLGLVINYQLPSQAEVFVHRIGRTGRADAKGVACSVFTEHESYRLVMLDELIEGEIKIESLPLHKLSDKKPAKSLMVTLQIDGGKKKKLRPGDILGALTSEHIISASQIGKIDLSDQCAYVAVERTIYKTALQHLNKSKIKGLSFRVRRIS